MKCCILFPFLLGASVAQAQLSKIIFQDDFHKLSRNWRMEIEKPADSDVVVRNHHLIMDVSAGATIWLRKKLTGNIIIEYDRIILSDYSKNSRLSDLNQFWMATDPHRSQFLIRQGKLSSYDSLSLYYFGIGGNSNKTTRFRKYDGLGNRILLQEYVDSSHLLRPDVNYHVKTSIIGNRIEVFINGISYFDYNDPQVLKNGYFGFRLTWSSQSISNFKIYRVLEK